MYIVEDVQIYSRLEKIRITIIPQIVTTILPLKKYSAPFIKFNSDLVKVLASIVAINPG